MYDDLKEQEDRLATVRIHSVPKRKSLLNETSESSKDDENKDGSEMPKGEGGESGLPNVPKIFYGKLGMVPVLFYLVGGSNSYCG